MVLKEGPSAAAAAAALVLWLLASTQNMHTFFVEQKGSAKCQKQLACCPGFSFSELFFVNCSGSRQSVLGCVATVS